MPPQDKIENFNESDKGGAKDRPADSLGEARTVDGKAVQAVQKQNRDMCTSMTDIPALGQMGTTTANQGFCLTDGEQVIASKTVKQPGIEVEDRSVSIGTRDYKADEVIAKAPEQMHVVDMRDDFRPSGRDIVNKAEELGKDPHRWESRTTGKCNQFVEAALQEAGIPVPWKAGQADCHAMREALDKECEKPNAKWEKVYNYDPSHGLQSDEKFTHYQPKNGDIMIWDKVWGDKWVQHSGIAAEPYDMVYAGARDPKKHGVGKTDISNFTGAEPYGAPSAVYRYKG